MKKFTRLIFLTALWMTAPTGPGHALAQGFKPSRPIEVVVHSAPGAGSDVFARAIGQIIEREGFLMQRWQVVNKPGGSGGKAMAYLAEKRGETHTIAFFTGVWIVTPMTREEVKYTIKDFSPLVRLVLEPTIAVVKADSPYKSFRDLIEAAKRNPGKFKQAGGSVTSVDNLFRLVIQKATGAKWDYIPFPGGGERISNLLGGNVHLMLTQAQEINEYLRAGNIRVIASLTEKRLADFPTVPTIKEQGIDIPILAQARGVIGSSGIPQEVIKYWEDFFRRLTQTASWKKYVEENQLETAYLNSRDLAGFLDQLTDQLRSVLKEAGAKVVR